MGATDSDDSTSDSEAVDQDSLSSEFMKEKFVIIIMNEVPDKSPSDEELIDAKLTHLNRKTCRALKKILPGKRLIAL